MYIDASSVIAVALVALVLIFIRISWTLKDIHEAILARTEAVPVAQAKPAAQAASAAAAQEEAPEETEIAAVIAIAHAALRDAV